MVKQSLIVSATCTNVASIEFPADSRWAVDVAGPGGAEVREGVVIDPSEVIELEGSRGTAQLAIRFEGNRHAAHVCVIRSGGTLTGTGEEAEALRGCVLQVECRGCELSNWRPLHPVEVRAGTGARFAEVGLEDLEWADYDAEADASVEVMAVAHEIVTGVVE